MLNFNKSLFTSRKYALKQGNRIGVRFIKHDIQGCILKMESVSNETIEKYWCFSVS
jgi:hypothetical protein